MGNEKGNKDSINSKDFLIGTLIGSIVGASVALLLAPKSGRELRQDLNQGARTVRDRAGEWKDVAYEKGSEWSQQIQDKGKELSSKVKETTGQWQEKMNQFKNETFNNGVDAAKDLADAIDEAANELERQEANELFERSLDKE
ncbi:YtxH domain-containing protein [Bacillaceae bacterium W0354]